MRWSCPRLTTRMTTHSVICWMAGLMLVSGVAADEPLPDISGSLEIPRLATTPRGLRRG